MKQLGEILLDDGLVTEAQLLAALDETMARGSSLGRTLVELGVLTEGQLVKALAAQVGMDVRRPRRLPGRPHRRRAGARRALPPLHGAARRARGRRRSCSRRPTPATSWPSTTCAPCPGMPVIPVIADARQPAARDRPVLPRRRRDGRPLAGVRGARSTSRGRPVEDGRHRRRRRADRALRQPAGHARRSPTAPRTSTSSRPSTTCASATASTACCTRRSARPSRSRAA